MHARHYFFDLAYVTRRDQQNNCDIYRDGKCACVDWFNCISFHTDGNIYQVEQTQIQLKCWVKYKQSQLTPEKPLLTHTPGKQYLLL